MTSEVWQALGDFLYSGQLNLTTQLCADFFDLTEQLGMRQLLKEVDAHLAKFDRPARHTKPPRSFDDRSRADADDREFTPGRPLKPPKKKKRKWFKRSVGRPPKRAQGEAGERALILFVDRFCDLAICLYMYMYLVFSILRWHGQ